MHTLFVRRRMLTLATLSAATLLVACGEDKRVKQLNLGITRDSAMSVLATEIKGGGHDAFPNVYTRESFLIAGKTVEVLYFTPNNEKPARDSVPMKKLTPLVFMDNILVAKGWSAWDSISTANKIPLKDRSK